MYEDFFRLKRNPFSLLPDPAFLYQSRQHSMALTLLKYSLVSNHPFTVITGEVGAGKTTVINQLLNEIDNRHTVGLLNFTDQRISVLWPWILRTFDLPYSKKLHTVEMYEMFLTYLRNSIQESGATTVLIVDEAQNLGPQALENLRMLSNVNTTETLLQLILVGQPEFRDKLKRPDLRQLTQRISFFYRLDPLSEAEAHKYIAHRLKIAGGSPEIFSSEAMSIIWKEGEGIARRINTLCDLALVYGFSCDAKVINADVVNEALVDWREFAVHTDKPEASDEVVSSAPRLKNVAGGHQR